MDFDHLSRIKALVSLKTDKKSANILEGSYKSMFIGRSMEFEDLHEYMPGDNVKDIDWKSSSRVGKVLVRRYVSERRHNILIIADSGAKMDADTLSGDDKAQVACDAAGTVAYLAGGLGNDFALLQSTPKGMFFSGFKSGNLHFEQVMTALERNIRQEPREGLRECVEYAAEKLRRRMVVFIVTDIDGIASIDDRLMKEIGVLCDAMIIDIDDAYLIGGDSFDKEAGRYEPRFSLIDKKLATAERNERSRILAEADRLCDRYGAGRTRITGHAEVIDRTVELLGKDNHAVLC